MALSRVSDSILAFSTIVMTSPIWLIIALLQKVSSSGPIFFTQTRMGKTGKPFTIYKFRSMINQAEKLKPELMAKNEADGPVFKIRNDPRFTSFGKFLAHTGLDELPQLINILKGDMTWVGPRPLPISEALRLTQSQRRRESVLPGITSLWVINGSHNLSFRKWMELDNYYIHHRSLKLDAYILVKTIMLVLRNIFL